jgi:predicted amidophosphoribosyltransferase
MEVFENCSVNFSAGLLDLVFPTRCLGCGVLQVQLCQICSKDLQLHDYRSSLGAVPIFSSIRYGPKAGHILLAAKEDGVRRADDFLVAALANSFRSAVRTLGIRPALIPIPHSNKALRKRGRDFVAEIAERLSKIEAIPVRQIIWHNRKVNDQAAMDASSRLGNLSGAMSVIRNCGRPCEVFLIDDLITTGATLSEAVRALETGGFHVVAAVTALVALPLR